MNGKANCLLIANGIIPPPLRIGNEAHDAYLLFIERCFEFKKEIIYKGY